MMDSGIVEHFITVYGKKEFGTMELGKQDIGWMEHGKQEIGYLEYGIMAYGKVEQKRECRY